MFGEVCVGSLAVSGCSSHTGLASDFLRHADYWPRSIGMSPSVCALSDGCVDNAGGLQ